MAIRWISFPQFRAATPLALQVVNAFDAASAHLSASDMNSNEVLSHVRPALEQAGFKVETGKRRDEKISVPVLYGEGGAIKKFFDADAYHREQRFVLEVEAGGGVTNYKFLKDLFQVCMMEDVDYLCIAVLNRYEASGRNDFEHVVKFMETLYASQRLELPLHGVLIIGY
jgi:hypothetical protein